MVDINDKVKTKEQVKLEHQVNSGQPQFSEVEVLAESGIFKNGVQYKKGDTAIIPHQAATDFAAIGEVRIVGGADVPAETQEAIQNAQNT